MRGSVVIQIRIPYPSIFHTNVINAHIVPKGSGKVSLGFSSVFLINKESAIFPIALVKSGCFVYCDLWMCTSVPPYGAERAWIHLCIKKIRKSVWIDVCYSISLRHVNEFGFNLPQIRIIVLSTWFLLILPTRGIIFNLRTKLKVEASIIIKYMPHSYTNGTLLDSSYSHNWVWK